MKIAQVVPLYEAVPPRLYGGTERVAAHLTDALVRLGHEVTLFASAEAETRATLIPVRDQAIRLDPAPLKSDLAAHLTMLFEVRLRAGEFDVIHFHIDMLHFPMFEDLAERTITTLHGRLDLKDLPEVYRRWTAYPLVSVSTHQRKPLPNANWIGTVYHGVPAELYTFHLRSEGYLAFLGRISPEKRPDRPIEIARRCGKSHEQNQRVRFAFSTGRIYCYREGTRLAQSRPQPVRQQKTQIGPVGEIETIACSGSTAGFLWSRRRRPV
jgi:glycosyltransferase involved in cell wall biosynthesis